MRYFYAFLLLALGLGRPVHAQQPFLKYGVTVKVATLSNGRFQEFFTNDSLRRIGSVVYDTRLHRVAYLLPPDSLVGHAKAEITSRWMSPDPLAEKFMYESPYNFVSNNPVNKFDPDGRSGIAAIDAQNRTVTVTSHMVFYGGAGNANMAQNIASSIQNQWNGANGTTKIGGETYKVQFVVTGEYRNDLGAQEVQDNKDFSNNYVLLQDGKTPQGHSKYGGNDGIFQTGEMNDGSNTASHEYGHGLDNGKSKYNGRGLYEGHPTDRNGRVSSQDEPGRPGIMYPRGSDAALEYSKPGNNNELDPTQRAANQADIDFIGLGNLQYNQAGQANVGILTNAKYPDPAATR